MTPDTLVATWDGATAEELARRCQLPRVELLAETESTQDISHALAEAGAPAGTTVLADAQRAGRGRLGRAWSSEPGRGVWCTVLERPRQDSALDVLSLRVGLHCAEALDAFANVRVCVKWPNDLVIPRSPSPVIPSEARDLHLFGAGSATRDPHYGKLGGVLVEARWSGSSLAWVAIGVGVNVVAPPGVRDAAALMNDVRRKDAFAALVRAVRSAAAADGHFSDAELARYHARNVLVGRRIVQPVVGIVAGITATGSLVVETARGTEQVRAGTIVLDNEEHA